MTKPTHIEKRGFSVPGDMPQPPIPPVMTSGGGDPGAPASASITGIERARLRVKCLEAVQVLRAHNSTAVDLVAAARILEAYVLE